MTNQLHPQQKFVLWSCVYLYFMSWVFFYGLHYLMAFLVGTISFLMGMGVLSNRVHRWLWQSHEYNNVN